MNVMILSVRRSVGLEDEFSYNNGHECVNFKYKSKIRESKVQTATGYHPNTKCTRIEAVSIYNDKVQETILTRSLQC